MSLSPRAQAAALVPESDEREVYLLTVTHPSWAEPVRLSSDPTHVIGEDEESGLPLYGTRSRGMTFLYLPMNVIQPDSRAETPPECRIAFENVSRHLSPYLMIADRDVPRVTVEVALASSPDIIDQTWPELDLSAVQTDASTAEARITMNTSAQEPCPWLRFTGDAFPNLMNF